MNDEDYVFIFIIILFFISAFSFLLFPWLPTNP